VYGERKKEKMNSNAGKVKIDSEKCLVDAVADWLTWSRFVGILMMGCAVALLISAFVAPRGEIEWLLNATRFY